MPICRVQQFYCGLSSYLNGLSLESFYYCPKFGDDLIRLRILGPYLLKVIEQRQQFHLPRFSHQSVKVIVILSLLRLGQWFAEIRALKSDHPSYSNINIGVIITTAKMVYMKTPDLTKCVVVSSCPLLVMR